MTHGRLTWCMALLLVALAAPSNARADATDDLISRAITDYGLGRFDESRRLLEQALTKATSAAQKARAQLYLGVNAAAQGDEKRAVKHFKAALGHDVALEVNASAVKPAVLALFRRVRTQSTGRVAVTLEQPAAVVIVDGREVGPAPQILRLSTGKHRVAVRLRGGKTLYSRQINVAAGHTLRVEASAEAPAARGAVALQVSPNSARLLVDGKPVDAGKLELAVGRHHVTAWAPGHKQATRTIDVSRGATARLTISLEPDARGALPGSRRRIWTWVAGASALVAIGVGAGFAVASQRDFSTYNDNCVESRAGDVRCVDLQRRIDNRDLAANALFGVGIGLAAAGVALWFIEGALLRKERVRSAGPRFSPLLGQVNGGSLRVTF